VAAHADADAAKQACGVIQYAGKARGAMQKGASVESKEPYGQNKIGLFPNQQYERWRSHFL
jgi:hypothetical protein